MKKKLTTSKLLLLAVFLMSIEIIMFCEFMMAKFGDFSSMYALIGVPATLVPTIISYYVKSRAENTVGGITYDTAMLEYNQNLGGENEQIVLGNEDAVG